MATTTTMIDLSKTGGEYQPLAPWSMTRVAGGWAQGDRAANMEAREAVEAALQAAGFRFSGSNPATSGWYARGLYAGIAYSVEHGTIGVEISRAPTLASYEMHQLDGTYDTLPLAEKHRLSGAGGTLEGWLRLFDRAGKPRPGDGMR